METNKKIGKSVLIMAFSILIMSCTPHTAGDLPGEPDKTVSETQKTEDAANEVESKETGESAAGEELTGEQSENEAVPDSAVYNAGEEIPDSDPSDSDNETEYTGKADDEGEIVIPSD